MKIRKGFVSNSSTSSFMIYGTYFEESVFEDKYCDGNDAYDSFNTLLEKVESLGHDTNGLLYEFTDDYIYVGYSWDSINDDETGKEFKNRVEKTLKYMFDESIELDTHNEAYYC
jgi:hypothetical protein